MKYTCPTCGGVLNAPNQRKLDAMIIVHRGYCPGYTKKGEKT